MKTPQEALKYWHNSAEILEALDRAGYVILPKEPTEAMTDHEDYVRGNWSRRNWEAILRSAGVSA